MRRLTVLAGALGAALLMSSAAFAQVPADPNNPNENIPEASNPPPMAPPINIETAKKAAAAAIAEAKKRNWNTMCIAVVDTARRACLFRAAGQLPIRVDPRSLSTRRALRPAIGGPTARV